MNSPSLRVASPKCLARSPKFSRICTFGQWSFARTTVQTSALIKAKPRQAAQSFGPESNHALLPSSVQKPAPMPNHFWVVRAQSAFAAILWCRCWCAREAKPRASWPRLGAFGYLWGFFAGQHGTKMTNHFFDASWDRFLDGFGCFLLYPTDPKLVPKWDHK